MAVRQRGTSSHKLPKTCKFYPYLSVIASKATLGCFKVPAYILCRKRGEESEVQNLGPHAYTLVHGLIQPVFQVTMHSQRIPQPIYLLLRLLQAQLCNTKCAE